MLLFVCGASGSGKSAYAEERAAALKKADPDKPFIYVATMMGEDLESKEKIKRHRRMREGKGFETVEVFFARELTKVPDKSIVLLDCMSNLVANEQFAKGGAKEKVRQVILTELEKLVLRCVHVVVVTNDVFSDGVQYDNMTKEYMKNLGDVNRALAEQAIELVEVVYGIKVWHKR